MLRLKSPWLAIVILTATILSFQNCAASKGAPPQSSSAASINFPPEDDIIYLSVPAAEQIRYVGTPLGIGVSAMSLSGLPLEYQWSKEGVQVAGQINNSFNIPSVALADDGNYSVTVKNSIQSDTLNIRVRISTTPVINFTVQPQPLLLLAGSGGTLSSLAASSDNQVIAYRWSKDNLPLANATAASLMIGNTGAARAGQYFVEASSTVGPTQKIKSNTVRVAVQDLIDVNTATGCVNGFCACGDASTGGGVIPPDRNAALAICVLKGYADVTTFTTVSGVGLSNICNANGTVCGVGLFGLLKLVCTSVTCVK